MTRHQLSGNLGAPDGLSAFFALGPARRAKSVLSMNWLGQAKLLAIIA
jgi:hypothetical protein